MAKVAAAETSEDPLKLGEVYATSPVKLNVLPVCSVVAVVALPVNAPVNPVDVTEVKPAKEGAVAPNAIFVEPIVKLLFASFAFVTLASNIFGVVITSVPIVVTPVLLIVTSPDIVTSAAWFSALPTIILPLFNVEPKDETPVIVVFPAAVNLPLESTVKVGT